MLPRGPAPTEAPASFRLSIARSAFASILHRLDEARARGNVPRDLEEEYDQKLAELGAAEAAARAGEAR